MARLEYICLPLQRCEVESDTVRYVRQDVVDPKTKLRKPVTAERTPQIVCSSGEFWSEANFWLLSRTRLLLSGTLKPGTIGYNGKDIPAYADWLEHGGTRWWECNPKEDLRPLNKYRGYLAKGYESDLLAATLASRRMSTVKAFYRWLLEERILSPGFP